MNGSLPGEKTINEPPRAVHFLDGLQGNQYRLGFFLYVVKTAHQIIDVSHQDLA